MLLELKDGTVSIDRKPTTKNFIWNITPETNLIRIKTQLLSEGDPEDVDLRVHYSLPIIAINPPSLAFDIQCQEVKRNLYFSFRLSMNLLMKFMVNGNFNGERIVKQINSPIELLNLIKSMI